MRLRHVLTVGFSLTTIAWLTFAGVLHNSFLAEDFWQSHLWQFPEWWIKFATLPGGGGYRPLMFVGWAAWGSVWGAQPFPYRVITLLGHVLNASLVFSLTRRLLRHTHLGLAAAVLFVVFPTSTEAVNWLSAASNQMLCVFGYVLGLRAIVSLSTTPHWKWSLLSWVGMGLALGSNEIGLTWPAAALLVSLRVNPSRPSFKHVSVWLKSRARFAWPLALGWTAFLVWRTIAVKGLGGYGAAVHLRGGPWLREALLIYLNYFWQPIQSAITAMGGATWADFNVRHRLMATAAQMIGIGILIIGSGVALWRGRHAAALTLIFLIPAWTIPAAHRAYLMGAGMALFFATALDAWLRLAAQFRLRGVMATVVVAMVALGVMVEKTSATNRNAQWREASRWAQQILAETRTLEPHPADGTTFYYFNLPQYYASTYAFTWGLPQAVQDEYRNATLNAYQVYASAAPARIKANLERSLEQVTQAPDLASVYLVYRPTPDGALLVRVARDEFLLLTEPQTP